jgi:hypothetical protein
LAKIDLDSLGIEELASLHENATDKLFEKVAPRRARSGAGKACAIRQGTSEESGKRTCAQGKEIRKGAEGIGRRGRVIKAAR